MEYNKPIRVNFTESELAEQGVFKETTGMSYNALTDKAISYCIENQLVEHQKQISPQKEKRIFRERKVTDKTYENLIKFCAAQNLTISTVTAQSISFFIKMRKGRTNL